MFEPSNVMFEHWPWRITIELDHADRWRWTISCIKIPIVYGRKDTFDESKADAIKYFTESIARQAGEAVEKLKGALA